MRTTPSPTPNPEGWEESFDNYVKDLKNADYQSEEVVYFGYRHSDSQNISHTVTDWGHIKAFIRDLIAQQRQAILEFIEKNKFTDPSQAGQFALHADGYNEALDDLTAYLTKGETDKV